MLVRSLVIRFDGPLPNEAKVLMEDFRLAVNKAIRLGLRSKITSKYAFSRLAYQDLRKEHPGMYSQHLLSVLEVAGSILKNHRRRLRKGIECETPFVQRLFMKAVNQAYKLDKDQGILDLPVRAGLHIKLRLLLSEYHRRYLNDHSLSLGSLTLLPDRVIVTVRKHSPAQYKPESFLSLDTNERSIDGILTKDGNIEIVKASFTDVSTIQERHHVRRRRLQKKKSYDRCTMRRLCSREGKRERDRIECRLHVTANAIIEFAKEHKSKIILEELTRFTPRWSKEMNHRISIWPRRKLHRIIEYKAEWFGIPIIKVNPRYSSRRCSACGRIQNSRKGINFSCECGWHIGKHINASINLLKTAAPEAVGGLRFDPGAFQHDTVMVLYGKVKSARPESNGMNYTRTAG